jgi:hypothetical protein
MLSGFAILSGEPMRYSHCAVRDSGLRRIGATLDVTEESIGVSSCRRQLATDGAAEPQAVVGRQPFGRVLVARHGFASLGEGFRRFPRALAACRQERVAIGHMQLRPLARAASRLPASRLVGHGDGLAEVGDRLLEGRPAKGLVAGLAPPFDGEVVEASLCEMTRDHSRLGHGSLGLIAQKLSGAAVQRLAAAPEQAVISRVLYQRVFEAIVGLRRRALDKQKVGVREPLQRRLQRRLLRFGYIAQQRIGKIASEHSANLRDFARRAEPIQPRGERLLQGWRDGVNTALLPALKKQARHLLDEQRHSPCSLANLVDYVFGERMARRDLADHARDPSAIKGAERDHAVMRTQAPGRAELWAGRRQQEQRCLRPAFGEGAQQVERRRVRPVKILEGDDGRLRPRSGQNPSGHRRQLPSPQLLRRQVGGAALRQWDVHERRKQRRVFRRVEPDQPQRAFKVGEPLVGGRIRAKTLTAPFGNRMHRRVLEQLRCAPFDPGVRRFREMCMELLNEPRFSKSRLADDQHKLTFARPSTLPAARKHAQFLLATDKGRDRASAAPSTAAAGADDTKELDRRGYAFEFARGLLLGDEQPCDLALNIHGDQHRTWLGRGLNARRDVRRVAKHLSGRLHDHRPRLDADTSGQLSGVLGRIPRVDIRKAALDRQRSSHRPLGVVLLRLRIAEERHQPVAQPLKDMAAEPGHGACGFIEISVHEVAPVFGVKLRGETGRPDEIAKHHGDRATLGRDSGILGRPRL